MSATLALVGPTPFSSAMYAFLQDTDANLRWAFILPPDAAAPDWAGAVLYGSSDNSTFPDQIATDRSPATFGYATTTLGAHASSRSGTGSYAHGGACRWGFRATQLNVLNGSNQICR